MDMKIGVSGASGHLGKAVVSELLQRADGHEVIAISRTPETVTAPTEGRFGDYDHPGSLAEAYADLDRLLIIPSLNAGKRGEQNVAAIDAAVSAGVKHMVFMSAAGARLAQGPVLGTPYWWGEQRLNRYGAGVDDPAYELLCRKFRAAGAGLAVTGRAGRTRREPCCFCRAR